MTTPHVIASSSGHHSQSTTSNGIVGNHFRVGKKIGEGSFGVVFEGRPIQTNMLFPASHYKFWALEFSNAEMTLIVRPVVMEMQ